MKNNLAYIFMLAVTLTSCNGFLDIKPDDKTIPETPEDFSAIIHEMCDEIERGQTSTVGAKAAMEAAGAYSMACWCDNFETNLT